MYCWHYLSEAPFQSPLLRDLSTFLRRSFLGIDSGRTDLVDESISLSLSFYPCGNLPVNGKRILRPYN